MTLIVSKGWELHGASLYPRLWHVCNRFTMPMHLDTLFVTFCFWIDALQRQVLERGRQEGNRQPPLGHTQSEPL